MEAIRNILGIIASAIAIANFIFSLFKFFAGSSLDANLSVILEFPGEYLSLQILIFLFLEIILAYTFGLGAIVILTKNDLSAIPVFVFILLFSAWTSIFNIQWLILGFSVEETNLYFLKFIILCIIANTIATIYLKNHAEKKQVLIQPIAQFYERKLRSKLMKREIQSIGLTTGLKDVFKDVFKDIFFLNMNKGVEMHRRIELALTANRKALASRSSYTLFSLLFLLQGLAFILMGVTSIKIV